MSDYIAIVGNGLKTPGHAGEIDGARCIIRFNKQPYGPDVGGARTDILFVVNSSHHSRKWLADPDYLSCPYIAHAGRVILPWHPEAVRRYLPLAKLKHRLRGRKAHYTQLAFDVFGQLGKEVSLLPMSFNERCYHELELRPEDRTRPVPSTGFMGICYALDAFPDCEIRLFGFSWEGWDGHAWNREESWLETNARVRMPPSSK